MGKGARLKRERRRRMTEIVVPMVPGDSVPTAEESAAASLVPVFEVARVIPGEGIQVRQVSAGGARGEPIRVVDEELSYLFEPGNHYGAVPGPDGVPRPLRCSCPMCDELIRRGRERLRRSRA